MPSIASNPDRWDYGPDELGELPEDSKPTAATPKPEARPCAGATDRDCANLVEPRWVAPRSSPAGGLGHGGYWSPGHLCPACKAAQEDATYRRRLGELVAASGVPHRYAWANFDRHVKQDRAEAWADFRDRLDQVSEAARQDGVGGYLGITAWNAPVAASVRDWRPSQTCRPTPRVIYLTGPVGSGKTTLAAAAAMATLRALARDRDNYQADRYRVAWISAGDLWETLRLETGGKAQRGALARWAAADVLILDDLGTLEGIKAWHRDSMEFLICHRYNANLPTLITSNLRLDSEDPEEPTIAGLYGERVVSRLVEGLGGRRHGRPAGYLELLGMDWRADVPHPLPDPARPPSPSSSPAAPTPAARPAQPSLLDWRQRQAGERDDD